MNNPTLTLLLSVLALLAGAAALVVVGLLAHTILAG